MNAVVIFIVGFIIGWSFSIFLNRSKFIGLLRIDVSDPNDNPYLFLELLEEMNVVLRKKYIILKIEFNEVITRE
jgi:hypothetical protein